MQIEALNFKDIWILGDKKRPLRDGAAFLRSADQAAEVQLLLDGRFAEGTLAIFLKGHRRGAVSQVGKLGVGQIEKQHHD